jgi:hypothetical protein
MQQLPLHYPALDIIEYVLVKGEKPYISHAFHSFSPYPFPFNRQVLGRVAQTNMAVSNFRWKSATIDFLLWSKCACVKQILL